MPRTPKTRSGQRKTTGRVMHEFAHGELKSGRSGKGGKVKSRKQAIAIALHEAGASKYDTPAERKRAYRRTKSKESRGETYQQEVEGKSHLGARGKRESGRRTVGGTTRRRATRRGKNGRKTTKR